MSSGGAQAAAPADASIRKNPMGMGGISTIRRASVDAAVVEAIRSYFAQEKHQLTLTLGERITVIEKDPTGWWIGRNLKGQVGIFPCSYVKEVANVAPPETIREEISAARIVSELRLSAVAQVYSQPGEFDLVASEVDIDDIYAMDDNEIEISLAEMAKTRDHLTKETARMLALLVEKSNNSGNDLLLQEKQHLIISEKRVKELSGLQISLQDELNDLIEILENRGHPVPAEILASRTAPQLSSPNEPLPKSKTAEVSTPTTPQAPGTEWVKAVEDPKLQKYCLQLEAQLREKNSDLDEMEDRLEELVKVMKQKEATLAGKMTEIERGTTERQNNLLRKLDAQLAEVQKQCDVAKKEAAEGRERVSQLENQLDDLEQKVLAGREEYLEYQELENNLQSQLEGAGEIRQKRAEIMKAKEQLFKYVEMSNELQEKWESEEKVMQRELEKDLAQYKTLERRRRVLHNEIQELKGNLRVYCRFKPIFEGESNEHIEYIDDMTVSVTDPDNYRKHNFEFDLVLGEKSTQEEIFEEVRALATSVLDGYNVCIFAYGQTGSGKTYTMEGPPECRGVNFRTLNELFEIAKSRGSDYHCDVEVSILEVYNNVVYDLLNQRTQCKVRWGGEQHGVIVEPLATVQVHSNADVQERLEEAYRFRTVAGTDINAHSSRSHCVLTVYIRATDKASHTSLKGKLHLIDLAGSERIKVSNVQGDRLKEAMSINTSLTHLKTVIQNLATKSGHVAYRNSILTSLLQDSLGGNCKCLMFANACANMENASETICTLKYASDARKVQVGRVSANVAASSED